MKIVRRSMIQTMVNLSPIIRQSIEIRSAFHFEITYRVFARDCDSLRWLNPRDRNWYTVSAQRRGSGRAYWYLRAGGRRLYLGRRPTAERIAAVAADAGIG